MFIRAVGRLLEGRRQNAVVATSTFLEVLVEFRVHHSAIHLKEVLSMKTRSLFLSASLTAFILVVIAGVVRVGADAFRMRSSNSVPPVGQASQVAVALPATGAPTETTAPTATTSPYISPEEAVALAAARLGSTELYSVETTKFGGMDVYKVTFSSGNIVMVSPEGHILYVTSLTKVVQ